MRERDADRLGVPLRLEMGGRPPALTAAQYDEIQSLDRARRAALTQPQIAARYGVSRTLVDLVGRGYRPKKILRWQQ